MVHYILENPWLEESIGAIDIITNSLLKDIHKKGIEEIYVASNLL